MSDATSVHGPRHIGTLMERQAEEMQMNDSSIIRNQGNIGKLLLESGKLSATQAEEVLVLQRETGIRFGEAAIKLGFIEAGDITVALSKQFSYAYLSDVGGKLDKSLIAAYAPFAPEVEQIRSLRTQLTLRGIQAGNNVIAMIPTQDGEDCSVIAANLAIVFSQLGERTLLVDANLRSPVQNTLFGLDGRQGLSDILADRCGLDAIMRIAGLRDLSLLPAGTAVPNPQEMLSRPRMESLTIELKSMYEVVIIDCAPSLVAADCQIVAQRAGAAVLVAKNGVSRIEELKDLNAKLQHAGVNVLGAVYNAL